ncbi:MAG: GspE family protein [SAR324 cluster bacterium]|nr:GspE family protein [SAR324 cluster bacterium]
MLKNACRAASGMVIMVGPTGSGKTTTLYAMLNLINSLKEHPYH